MNSELKGVYSCMFSDDYRLVGVMHEPVLDQYTIIFAKPSQWPYDPPDAEYHVIHKLEATDGE